MTWYSNFILFFIFKFKLLFFPFVLFYSFHFLFLVEKVCIHVLEKNSGTDRTILQKPNPVLQTLNPESSLAVAIPKFSRQTNGEWSQTARALLFTRKAWKYIENIKMVRRRLLLLLKPCNFWYWYCTTKSFSFSVIFASSLRIRFTMTFFSACVFYAPWYCFYLPKASV